MRANLLLIAMSCPGFHATTFFCPRGFDCVSRTACPAIVIPCPPGYFCGSYANRSDQSEIDAKYVHWNVGKEADGKDPSLFVPPNRRVVSECFRGYKCPNATTLELCPAGTICPEGVTQAQGCSALALCGEGGAFAVSLEAAVLALAVGISLGTVSCVLISRQKKQEKLARMGKLTGHAHMQESVSITRDVIAASIPTETNASTGTGMTFDLHDVTVKTSNAQNSTAFVAGVTAQIPGGKVTCMLGPSGSGKSILLDAIRGRASGLHVSGSIFINGIQVKDLTKYSSIIGFVPQDDIIDRSLTVGELLWYNARCRLPRDYSDDKVQTIIDRVLTDLNIAGTRNVVIGGGANAAANISGGQVKRVNIAMELVAEPQALFLDGPTNGLDATAALDLIKTLDGIAKTGVTIVVIAQQPRVEVFEAMGHLLLLAANQKHSIAYEGEPAKAVDYICQLDRRFVFPQQLNPADWLLDVLNGDAGAVQGAAPVDFGARWAANSVGYTTNPSLPAAQQPEVLETRQSASFWQVMKLTIVTSLYTRLRDRSSLRTFTLLHVIMALAMASGFSPMIQGTPRASLNPTIHPSLIEYCPPILRERCKVNMQDMGLQQLLFFMSMSVGAASSMAAIKLYGGHMPVLKRMVDANFPLYAVGIGRLIADFSTIAMNTFLFVAVWMLTGNSGSWVDWLGTITLCGFAASGIGYIASLLTGVSNAGVICMAAVICFSVFSGVEPTLKQVSGLNIAALPWYLSFGTWTAEASYYAYTKWLQVDRNVQAGADKFGFEVSGGIGRSLGALAAIGIGYRIITLVLLHRLTVGKTRFWNDVISVFRKQPAPSTNTATVAPNQPHSRWYNVYMPQAVPKSTKQLGPTRPAAADSA